MPRNHVLYDMITGHTIKLFRKFIFKTNLIHYTLLFVKTKIGALSLSPLWIPFTSCLIYNSLP